MAENSTPVINYDKATSLHYRDGPPKFVPGFSTLHRMVVQLLREKIGDKSTVLVVGAGGGLEIKMFTEAEPNWSFIGVDPSKAMLEEAKNFLGNDANRVEWVEGKITEAPGGPFDAATCLLTLHLIPDDGSKLETLKEIRKRLKPGAPFAIVDNCMNGKNISQDEVWLNRYTEYAVNSGVPREVALNARAIVESMGTLISPEREEALLHEAGFSGVQLFFTGFSWRGYIAYA